MTIALARRFKVDVSTDNANWVPLKGLNDLSPKISNTTQSADDYESNGFTSIEKVMLSWVVTLKVLRKTTAGVFDAGQELIRAAMLQFGDQARVYVRWYDRNGGAEAYSGWAVVQYEPSGTAATALNEVTITLTGDGVLTAITNPATGSNIPVVASVSPANAGTGTAVAIYGSGFSGATAVKFNAVNATSYTVQSDSLITAVLPSGSAGSAPVIVTNASGSNSGFPYTRAA